MDTHRAAVKINYAQFGITKRSNRKKKQDATAIEQLIVETKFKSLPYLIFKMIT